MITDALLFMLFSFMYAVISILPSGEGFPPEVSNAINNVAGYLHTWDDLVPVEEIINATLFLIEVQIAIFIAWSVMWIIKYLRGN